MLIRLIFVFVLIAPGLGSADRGHEILQKTFDNLYDCDLKMLLEVELLDRQGRSSFRRAQIARKRIGGHTHSIGRFLEPPWMRGTTMLMIDNPDRSDDHFVYLPESKRTRRLTSVNGADAFLGSDLWYEDLERRYAQDYEIVGVTDTDDTIIVRSRPIPAIEAYEQIEFEVGREDFYLLRTSYYREASLPPFREITSTREHMIEQQGHRIPTRYVVRNGTRGTGTIARFNRIELNPELKDSLFRMVALEVGRKIPGLD